MVRMSCDLEAIQSQHQAAVRFGEQSELHAVLAGKALLQLRRNMRPREWRSLGDIFGSCFSQDF